MLDIRKYAGINEDKVDATGDNDADERMDYEEDEIDAMVIDKYNADAIGEDKDAIEEKQTRGIEMIDTMVFVKHSEAGNPERVINNTRDDEIPNSYTPAEVNDNNYGGDKQYINRKIIVIVILAAATLFLFTVEEIKLITQSLAQQRTKPIIRFTPVLQPMSQWAPTVMIK